MSVVAGVTGRAQERYPLYSKIRIDYTKRILDGGVKENEMDVKYQSLSILTYIL